MSRLGLVESFFYTPVMESVCLFGPPQWFGLVVRWVGSFPYTPRAGNYLVFRRVGSLSDTPIAVIFLVVRRVGSFSYTPRDGTCLVVLRLGSLSYIPPAAICLVVKRIRSFSFASRDGICLVVRRVGSLSYTPLVVCLVFGLCEFLLHTA